MTDDFKFPASDDQELKKLIQLRWLANKVLVMVVNSFDSATDIRIWPHHFDTGVLHILIKVRRLALVLAWPFQMTRSMIGISMHRVIMVLTQFKQQLQTVEKWGMAIWISERSCP